jgi:hypothetical protein
MHGFDQLKPKSLDRINLACTIALLAGAICAANLIYQASLDPGATEGHRTLELRVNDIQIGNSLK